MTRTDKSVLQRYNETEWVPDKSTQASAGPTASNWAQMLLANITTVPSTNRVTVTYIVRDSGANIIGAGYAHLDYTQSSALGIKPTVTLTHRSTDGVGTILQWVLHYKVLTSNLNRLALYLNVRQSGYTVDFTVESDDLSKIASINDGATFTNWVIPSDALLETLYGNQFWAQNENGGIYNTNFSGRIGVNTGSTIDSNVILDINGNVTIRGDIRIKKEGSDNVVIDSDSNLGYLFGITNSETDLPVFYIDTAHQVGINTNFPENMLHVVGNTQITERVSIGAGDSPAAKLHIVGEGNTYSTMSIYAVNSDGTDLFRVHDDGTIQVFSPIVGAIDLENLLIGNGLTGNYYNTETEVTIAVAYLIGSPTGVAYTP